MKFDRDAGVIPGAEANDAPTLAEILDSPRAAEIDGENAAVESRRAHLEALAGEGRLMTGVRPKKSHTFDPGRLWRLAEIMVSGKTPPKPVSDLPIIIDSKTVIPATKR